MRLEKADFARILLNTLFSVAYTLMQISRRADLLFSGIR